MVRSCVKACAFALVVGLATLSAAENQNQPITRYTFRDVSKKVSPGVVNIKIKSNIVFSRKSGKGVLPPNLGLDDEARELLERLFEQQMPYMTPDQQDSLKYSRSASGVIIRADGYVITSNHVVADTKAEDIEVSLSDGRSFDKVKIVGQDELTDLAVLKVEGTGLPALAWGDSDKMEVGDFVVAVGNPLEFNNTVSEGIVSAKHRTIEKAAIEDLIQTTAMINPGNSGGALCNLDGEIIGVNMAIATSTGMWSGLGFAIPSKIARDVSDQLISTGKVARGFLGIVMSPLEAGIARQLGYEGEYGIVVQDVHPNSAAEKAGIQRYDIISKVDGKEIKSINDMHRNVATHHAGESVDVEVYRGEGNAKAVARNVKVTLDQRPGQDELEKNGRPAEPKLPSHKPQETVLGLQVTPAPKGEGVVVEAVQPDSRAAKAKLRKGDIILEANKQKVSSQQDLQKALQGQSSDSHLLYIERDGRTAFVSIPAE